MSMPPRANAPKVEGSTAKHVNMGYWGATEQKSNIRATEGQNRVKETHFSTRRSPFDLNRGKFVHVADIL